MPKTKTQTAKLKGKDGTEVVVTADVKDASGKRRRNRTVRVLLEPDDVVREQVSGFVGFVREHAIVGLAVGFVIGQQAQGIVKELINSFIDPAFLLFFGNKLSDQTFTLHLGKNHADFGWGSMMHVLLNLLFVLAAIYIILKAFKLDKLDKKKS